ncbi:glycosyltransferase family protein [Methanobrevibacter wolinii]|uniref:hypothetical protein n=1 Tax=Methanobrevibacter wolinii TaxID=190977 RepID=UPI0005B27FA9|nr:hypothetical protein [Methanobrevibacter wolinii]MDD5960309.1 hypothetical protein [Methanobrevibacter wolinii]
MENKKSNTLVCIYNFLPYVDTSGNIVARKVYNHGEKVDIVHNKLKQRKDNEFYDLIKKYINNDIFLDTPINKDEYKWENTKKFVIDALNEINKITKKNGEYKVIYSRTMKPMSHYLAFAYKIKNPNVKWIAEFSDPNLPDIEGKIRYRPINHEDLNKINSIIYKNGYKTFNTDNYFFYSEYLPYILADEIIYTNENQRELMLENPDFKDIKKEVFNKSRIINHPLPDKKWYNIKESDYKIDKSKINLGYFGVFYKTRNIYNIFSSLYALDDNLKDKVLIHIFVPNPEKTREFINEMPIKDNIIINSYVSYLEYLNLTKKFDCLIVCDAKTKGIFDKNPYLPSKISDYLESGTDIWRICEKNSILSKIDTRYLSYIENIFTVEDTLKEIIKDHIK